jgi:DNA-binding transcriptional ArsR family regulator
MPKVTLDMNTFKALASDTRLDILRVLDGKRMSLNDICKATKLNKATLHEHLTKLNEAGLVKKKEREGHKWVYYKLTWKGEGLLHPENTRIVVMFSATFITLAVGIIQLINYVKGKIIAKAVNIVGSDSTLLYDIEKETELKAFAALDYSQAPIGNVSLLNQTTSQLSEEVIKKLEVKDALGNTIPPNNIDWDIATENVYGRVNETFRFVIDDVETADGAINGAGDIIAGEAPDVASNVPSHMVATVHDPALQWIAVTCIIIFTVLLCVSIWRFRKNRKSKL